MSSICHWSKWEARVKGHGTKEGQDICQTSFRLRHHCSGPRLASSPVHNKGHRASIAMHSHPCFPFRQGTRRLTEVNLLGLEETRIRDRSRSTHHYDILHAGVFLPSKPWPVCNFIRWGDDARNLAALRQSPAPALTTCCLSSQVPTESAIHPTKTARSSFI